MKYRLQRGDALLIIDAQVDFFPGGLLPVPHADEILPIINEWIAKATRSGVPIYASRDWHPSDHCSFTVNGGPWPPHCVQHSTGARVHPAICLPHNVIMIDKAEHPDKEAYSAFTGKTPSGIMLADNLKAQGVKQIWLNGLALDYCVCESALEGLAHGFEVHVILEGTRPLTLETGLEALRRMQEAGVVLEP